MLKEVLKQHEEAQIKNAKKILEQNGCTVLKPHKKNTTPVEKRRYWLTFSEIQETKKLTQWQKILWLCNRFGLIHESMAYDCFKISQFHTRMKELREGNYNETKYSFTSKWNKDIKQNEYRLVK